MSSILPNVIYGFDGSHLDSLKLENYLKMHELSTKMISSLGYKTELYTNVDLFDSFFDKVHKIKDSTFFWDGIKLIPYERNDDYMIIDYDVFMNKRLVFDKDVDFYFDSWESWKHYDEPIKILKELNINSVIPEWSSDKQKVMNTGILYFVNKDFKNLYYEKYKIYCNFCKNNIDILKKYDKFQMFGTIGSQYLLTILSNYYNITHYNFSNISGIKNEYYHHLVGPEKFNISFRTKSSFI